MKDRKTPFELIYPFQLTSELVAKLPSSPAAAALKQFTGEVNSEHCTWSLKPETRGNDVILRFDFVAKPGSHPPSAYGSFHDGWDSARRAWDRPLRW